MKKLFKKLLSISAAFMMMLSSITLVNAAESTGTIRFHTGSHDVNGTTFNVYRLLDATVSGQEGTNVAYKINKDFEAFFNEKGQNTDELAYEYVKTNVKDPTFQKELKDYINKNSTVASSSLVGATGTKTYTTEALPYGYYAIIPSTDTYAPSFTTLRGTTQDVYLKGTTPGVDKTVNNQKWDSAQIGETVDFKVVSMVPNMTGFDSYTFKFTDTMTNGLTVTEDTLNMSITIGTKKLTKGNDYTV